MGRSRSEELLAQYRAEKKAKDRKEGWMGLAIVVGALATLPFIRLLPDTPLDPGWVLGPGAVLFLLMALTDLRRQSRARRWVRTECIIEFAIVEPFRKGTSLPVVGFSYSWEGDEHLGTSLRPSMAGVSRSAARAEIQRYRPGHRDQCYVNPRKPSEAVLRAERSTYTPGFLLGVAVFFLIAWWGLSAGWLGG